MTIRKQGFRLVVLMVIALGLAPIITIMDKPKLEWQPRDDLTPKDLARVQQVIQPTRDFSKPEPFEAMQGGAGTSLHLVNRDAFSQNAKNISFDKQMDFELGNALFDKIWVSSPSSTLASDGLGPLHNARACQSCHLKDGRGRPPELAEAPVSMLLRLGQSASTSEQRREFAQGHKLVFPDPIYGSQLQNFAVPGLKAEGEMVIRYSYTTITLDDGTDVELRVPEYSVANLALGPLDEKTTLSPRVAPPMIGLGLIEHIHASDILAHADPDDSNKDGISGKPQILGPRVSDSGVSDSEALNPEALVSGSARLGRFGHKAAKASIREQSAEALAHDIGISSPDAPRHYGDCTPQQKACLSMAHGVQAHLGDTEAPDPILDLITFYAQNLAVPARRKVDHPDVLKGKSLFYQAGCISCHTPKYVTRRDAPQEAHRFQLIWPYSDFLLHDMGDGLADGQQVGQANGREWRTPPLWGIGLTYVVSGHTQFLHDGRARNLTEAILWHGGEAARSRDAFMAMNQDARRALIAFLESL